MQAHFKRSNLFSLVANLSLLGLLLALAACGGAANGGGSGPVTITVAFQQFGPPPYFDEAWWQQVKQRVEASNPNIKVKLDPIVADEGSYYTKIDLALRSSNSPDIVREDSFLVSSDVTANYLAPLDSYLNSWPDYKAKWFPSMQGFEMLLHGTQNILYNYQTSKWIAPGKGFTFMP
jgi:multiple sugar transport system substrate-binding protein